jgi:hypothetical protein
MLALSSSLSRTEPQLPEGCHPERSAQRGVKDLHFFQKQRENGCPSYRAVAIGWEGTILNPSVFSVCRKSATGL